MATLFGISASIQLHFERVLSIREHPPRRDIGLPVHTLLRRVGPARHDHEVADALVVIAEHTAGVTTTGPLCPAIATVLVFVARNAGKPEVAP